MTATFILSLLLSMQSDAQYIQLNAAYVHYRNCLHGFVRSHLEAGTSVADFEAGIAGACEQEAQAAHDATLIFHRGSPVLSEQDYANRIAEARAEAVETFRDYRGE